MTVGPLPGWNMDAGGEDDDDDDDALFFFVAAAEVAEWPWLLVELLELLVVLAVEHAFSSSR